MTMKTENKYAKPFYHAQERMRDNWLSKKSEYPEMTRCMWQETNPINGTNIAALECWLIGREMYIVELFNDGHFVTFKMEN